MMGKERVVLEMSLMSEIHLECEVRSLADCFHTGIIGVLVDCGRI